MRLFNIVIEHSPPARFLKYSITGGANTRFLIKDPIALFSAEWLYKQFSIDVVCMIRNPFAFIGSLKKANWDFDFNNISKQERLLNGLLIGYKEEIISLSNGEGGFIERACLLWNILHFRILRYQEERKDWKFVKYEDIAAEPLRLFSEIFDFLNLEYTQPIQEYIAEYTSNSNPSETSTTEYKPRNSKESLNTWRSRLSDSEIKIIKEKTSVLTNELYGSEFFV